MTVGHPSEETNVLVWSHATARSTVVSTRAGDGRPAGLSGRPSISADGRYVGFASLATSVAGSRSEAQQGYVWDRSTGRSTLITVGPNGTPGDDTSFMVNLSPSGAFATVGSSASNLARAPAGGSSEQVLFWTRAMR